MNHSGIPENNNKPLSGQMGTLSCIIWCAVSTSEQASEDKASLQTQENDARALIEREGWKLADAPMIVPGHSRRYLDFNELAKDARQAGIDAFDRLLRHIRQRDFGVLIVRDGDRFARTQALHAFITESVIDAGARIYSLADGWIDAGNYRMWIAMGGYRAAGEIDTLMKRFQMGMNKKAERGLPLGSHQIMSHLWQRDGNGKVVGQIVNPALARLWQDLARLLLERVAYHNLEKELYERFGHADPDTGKAYLRYRIFNVLRSPTFWGNSGRRWFKNAVGQAIPLWCIEPGHNPPPNVIIHYGTHEPVWTGETRQMIIHEIQRRREIGMRAATQGKYWFTGLFVCAECFYTMVATSGGQYLRCISVQWQGHETGRDCQNTRMPRVDYLKAWIDNALRQALERGIVAFSPDSADSAERLHDDAQALRAEIATLEAQARRLILDKSNADAVLSTFFDERLQTVAASLRAKQAALNALDIQQSALTGAQQSQLSAIQELKASDIDSFWRLPGKAQNRILIDLLGDNRLCIRDGLIVGFTKERQRRGVRRRKL